MQGEIERAWLIVTTTSDATTDIANALRPLTRRVVANDFLVLRGVAVSGGGPKHRARAMLGDNRERNCREFLQVHYCTVPLGDALFSCHLVIFWPTLWPTPLRCLAPQGGRHRLARRVLEGHGRAARADRPRVP